MIKKRKILGSLLALSMGSIIVSMNACTEFTAIGNLPIVNNPDIISASGFERVKQVLQKDCISCHRTGGSSTNFDLTTVQQFISSGLIVPGKPRQSKLIYRMRNFNDPNATTDNMPPSPASQISNNDYQEIYNWIANMPSDESPFACTDDTFRPANVEATHAKRLSIRQFSNTLRDLLFIGVNNSGTVNTIVNTALNQFELPTDTGPNFTRENNSFTGMHAQGFFDIADYVATQISANHLNNFVTRFISLSPGTCTSPNVTSLSTVCRDRFIHNFVSRAYRRPLRDSSQNLTTTQGTAINEPTSLAAEFGSGISTQHAVNNIIFRTLIAPHFLYQIEDQNLIQPQNLGNNTYLLSPYAFVSRLTYRFWNTMPDQTLWNMLTTENFNDNSGYSNVLNYVISQKNKLDDAMREYTYDWLKLSRTPNFNSSNQRIALIEPNVTFNQALRTDMIREVEEFGSYITTSGGTYADLFLSNVSLARSTNLMRIYSQSQASPAYASLNNTNAVRFPANTRVGILTRAAMLISGSEYSNPILRGAHLRKDILCLTLAAPPANAVDTFNGIEVPNNITTREKVNIKTSGNDCVGCHNLLNPLGFGFSNFDSLGRFITQEPYFNPTQNRIDGYVPVDSAVNLNALFGPGSSAANARELSQFVANQESAKVCFAEKLMTFTMARSVNRNADACRLDKIYSNLNETDPLIDAIRSTALDMEFRVRKIQ